MDQKTADAARVKYNFRLGADDYLLGYCKRHGISTPDEFADEKESGSAGPGDCKSMEHGCDVCKYVRDNGKANGASDAGHWRGPAQRHRLDECAAGLGDPEERDPFSKKEIAALRPGFMLDFE